MLGCAFMAGAAVPDVAETQAKRVLPERHQRCFFIPRGIPFLPSLPSLDLSILPNPCLVLLHAGGNRERRGRIVIIAPWRDGACPLWRE
eukprot:1068083-Rhodomonas_salina.1